MKFGIFDHLDRRDEPLSKFYDDRLKLAAAADAAGFYSYHVAEHHATPLGMAPSPNVFMAAMARETTKLRFGPMVYLLPLYHPVRLIEEVCMIDNLSNGRLDLGVGRGISPYEVGTYGIKAADTRPMFEEGLEVLLKGLTQDRLAHEGTWYRIPDMPLELHPMQKPTPPLWYAGGDERGAVFGARYGMHFVTLGGTERVAGVVRAYFDAWDSSKDDPARRLSRITAPLGGMGRNIVIADTDEEAERLARPAYAHWFDSVTKLWRAHGAAPVTGMMIASYDEARRLGVAIVGSPDTVRREIEAQARIIPFNYFVCQFAFGCLTHEQEMHSLRLFSSEVMPAIGARA
jgi:alkanesulfonate monooxygenase SsuD/methylene tetrahydromethanopterin reductase-like flavin-dependent oxidoreductase (luciferase family)